MALPSKDFQSFTFGDGDGDVAFADDEPRAAPEPRGQFHVEDVLFIPSLPARLRQLFDDGVDLGDPDVGRLVPADDVTRFCLHHGIELERALRLLRHQATYPVLIREGLLQSLYLNLIDYQEGDGERQTGVAIPVAELHCPPVEGCEVAYDVESSRDRSAGLKLSVRGVGAGGGLSARLHFEDRIYATAACGQVTVPGDVELVPWVRPDDGARIDVVSITGIAAGAWSLAPMPTGRPHYCAANAAELREVFEVQQRRGFVRQGEDYFGHTIAIPGGIRRCRTLKRTRSFSLGSELLELESKFTRQYGYSYDLRALGDYIGYFEDPRSEVFFWGWNVP